MSILSTITDDLKTAMKAKDVLARDVLRMLKSNLMEAELKKGGDLSEDEAMAVLIRAVKTRGESAEQYEAGDRPELAEKERAEITFIERYLPKSMTESEALEAMRSVAAELGVSEKRDLGKLMKATLERFKGQIDGKVASKIAGQILQ